MSATEATAEIFVTAFKALKRKEREAVLQKLVTDTQRKFGVSPYFRHTILPANLLSFALPIPEANRRI